MTLKLEWHRESEDLTELDIKDGLRGVFYGYLPDAHSEEGEYYRVELWVRDLKHVVEVQCGGRYLSHEIDNLKEQVVLHLAEDMIKTELARQLKPFLPKTHISQTTGAN